MTTTRWASTITPHQLAVLTFIAQREQWSVGEIASGLGVSSAAATKSIAHLQRKGLVTRSVDMKDRRCVNVRITRSGTDMVQQSAKPL